MSATRTASGGEGEELRRAAGGDLRAFRGLYERHHRRVYALALRLSAEPAVAEDLCQEVFLAAWRGLAGFSGHSRFSTWLHRLTVNQWLMGRRRGRLRIADDADPEAARALSPDLPAKLDLERAIQALPEQARAVFVLHDVEGHAHAEVGELLGIAAGSSKAHLHRARGLLKQWLETKT